MARKRKQSPFEDLIDIAAMLPWWAGVLVALVGYFVLHHFATAAVVPFTSVAQISTTLASQLGKTLASFGQYLIPLAFLVGAGVSAYKQRKRAGLFAKVEEHSSVSVLDGMSWREFELLVGEAFRRVGYSVVETGGGGADGGVDLVAKKDGEKFLIQCKQWKALKVGVGVIRELYGVMAAGGAAGGFVVTSGVFTQEAKAFAEGRNIDLIDGAELTSIIRKVRSQPQAVTATAQPLCQSSPAENPSCPKCGCAMVKRTARNGANAGNVFWGCSAYPQCRGLIPIS